MNGIRGIRSHKLIFLYITYVQPDTKPLSIIFHLIVLNIIHYITTFSLRMESYLYMFDMFIEMTRLGIENVMVEPEPVKHEANSIEMSSPSTSAKPSTTTPKAVTTPKKPAEKKKPVTPSANGEVKKPGGGVKGGKVTKAKTQQQQQQQRNKNNQVIII